MNIIDDQIKDVIENNNRAQAQFENLLNDYSKDTSEIIVKEPLYGELDLSVLVVNGFLQVKKIIIEEGKVTNIENIPHKLPMIRILHCTNNLLKNVENLPTSLEELNLNGNELAEIDISVLDNLKILSLNNNRLTTLENFPETLEEFHATSNQLTQLNFANVPSLKVVNISDNNILRIENLPESVNELNMENNPDIEFVNSSIPIQPKNGYRGSKKRMDVYDALDKYFKLENKYKKNQERARTTTETKTKPEKPKCVNCERNVGTKFFKKNQHYMAICGDETSPCDLQIDIFMGEYSSVDELMEVFKETTEELKVNIIKQKLDTLFNYTSEEESVENFKQTLEQYNADSEIYKGILDEYNLHMNNDVTKQLIAKYDNDIYKITEKMKVLVNEFKETNNKQLLTDATNMQLKELNPLVKKRRELAYPIMEMNHYTTEKKQIERDDIYGNEYDELFQYPITLDKLTSSSGTEASVIKFETGGTAK